MQERRLIVAMGMFPQLRLLSKKLPFKSMPVSCTQLVTSREVMKVLVQLSLVSPVHPVTFKAFRFVQFTIFSSASELMPETFSVRSLLKFITGTRPDAVAPVPEKSNPRTYSLLLSHVARPGGHVLGSGPNPIFNIVAVRLTLSMSF